QAYHRRRHASSDFNIGCINSYVIGVFNSKERTSKLDSSAIRISERGFLVGHENLSLTDTRNIFTNPIGALMEKLSRITRHGLRSPPNIFRSLDRVRFASVFDTYS